MLCSSTINDYVVFLCDEQMKSVACRHWDVLLGGDLGWSAAREFALTRGLEQMLPENAVMGV
jgi:hypothetical protein